MKCSAIQREMLREDMLYSVLQQTFKRALLSCTQAEKHRLSPFVSHFIDNSRK